MSEEQNIIDGHYQYNGGWKFYLSLQPGLQCETEDHSTCKTRSQALMDSRTIEQKQEHNAFIERQAQDVQTAAVQAGKDKKEAALREAGRRKWEARNAVNVKAQAAFAAAKEKASTRINKADEICSAEIDAAKQDLKNETESALQIQIQESKEVETRDFLAEVNKDPEMQTEA